MAIWVKCIVQHIIKKARHNKTYNTISQSQPLRATNMLPTIVKSKQIPSLQSIIFVRNYSHDSGRSAAAIADLHRQSRDFHLLRRLDNRPCLDQACCFGIHAVFVVVALWVKTV